MSVLRNYTRFDIAELHRWGQEFLKILQQKQTLREQRNHFRAWLNNVERLNNDDVDADKLMALDAELNDLKEFYDKNKPMFMNNFIAAVSRLVGIIGAIRYGYQFKPMTIDNDIYARFLRAAEFENGELGLGVSIVLTNVAKTAKIELTVARQCLARLVDDDLGYESKDKEDHFFIDQKRVRFYLNEFPSAKDRQADAVDQSGRKEVEMKWDIFICHASEDKEIFVQPLAEALQKLGLHVWYDKFSLTLGDSLRRSIDIGLRESRFGIVVLSYNFFEKQMPQKELDGLVQREMNGKKVILPIWHNVDRDYIMRYSPTLADRIAIESSKGLEEVVKEILRVVKIE